MAQLHQVAFYLHVSIGAFALLVFWIPVFARKGSLDHKRFGRYFAMAMYAISCSGLVMSTLDLVFPFAGHGGTEGLSEADQQAMAAKIRETAMFLFSLSVLVLTTTRHGWLVIQYKEQREKLRRPAHIALCIALMLVGIALFTTGAGSRSILFMAFGVLEIVVGAQALHYCFRMALSPKQWWIEHLGSLIASGIGAYTAFFVFGGGRLLARFLTGPLEGLSLLFWMGPSVIGAVAIAILSRKYRLKFAPKTVALSTNESIGNAINPS